MELTYDWKITALKKAPSLDGLSNVITHIRFAYTGTHAEFGESHSFQGACPVGAPSAENFSEITTLTEADIIEWAKANHPTDHMNEVIEKAISEKITPKNEDVTELDWLVIDTASAEPAVEKE
jgi:tRNA(Met) C34 N-acetyltransferase TmcA